MVLKLLERMLSMIEDHHVLVIHCHGMEGDYGTETAGTDTDLDQYHTDGSQKLSGTLYLFLTCVKPSKICYNAVESVTT